MSGILFQRHYKSEAGRELSRTGSNHDAKQARRENPKLPENPNFGIVDFSGKLEAREIFLLKFRILMEIIKNIQRIRTGIEKYSGLITGRKFTEKVDIGRMDRIARGGFI